MDQGFLDFLQQQRELDQGIISVFVNEKLESEGLLCWVLTAALGLSLVFSFILVPLQSFHLSRAYGIFLLLFYVTFLIIALLTEFGKIHI